MSQHDMKKESVFRARITIMQIKHIASARNATYKVLLRLLHGRGIRKEGLTLFSGLKAVREVLRDFPEACEAVIGPEAGPLEREAAGLAQALVLERTLFEALDLYGTGAPLLLVRYPYLGFWEAEPWPRGCTLFLPFQDPSNIGAAVRTAAALGAARAVLTREAAHPWHHRSARAAGACLFRLPLFQGPRLKDLSPNRTPLIALDPRGQAVFEFEFPQTFGLVPGLEGPGLPLDFEPSARVAIPMAAGVESLNAAMAVGIALYEWRRSLEKSGPE